MLYAYILNMYGADSNARAKKYIGFGLVLNERFPPLHFPALPEHKTRCPDIN